MNDVAGCMFVNEKDVEERENDNAGEKEEETNDKLREAGVKFKMSGVVLHQPGR